MKRKGPTPRKTWTPMKLCRLDQDEAGRTVEVWGNATYTATVTPHPQDDSNPLGVVELSIHTNTRSTRHDWREFQRVKNDIFGDDREAVELYPSESRLVDTANEYHLWVFPEGFRVPFGWTNRTVFDDRSMTPEVKTAMEDAVRGMGGNPVHLRKAKQRRLA